jgi:hypothetical protein
LLKKSPSPRLRLNADPSKDRHSIDNEMPYWHGTIVGIDISLNQTEEFSLLLEAIRKTYSSALKERRKARFRKPKFI